MSNAKSENHTVLSGLQCSLGTQIHSAFLYVTVHPQANFFHTRWVDGRINLQLPLSTSSHLGEGRLSAQSRGLPLCLTQCCSQSHRELITEMRAVSKVDCHRFRNKVISEMVTIATAEYLSELGSFRTHIFLFG